MREFTNHRLQLGTSLPLTLHDWLLRLGLNPNSIKSFELRRYLRLRVNHLCNRLIHGLVVILLR